MNTKCIHYKVNERKKVDAFILEAKRFEATKNNF